MWPKHHLISFKTLCKVQKSKSDACHSPGHISEQLHISSLLALHFVFWWNKKKLIIAAPKNHLRRIVASHIHQSCDGSCFWIYLRRSSGPRVVVDAPVKQSYVMSYSWSPGIRGAEFPEALNRNELYQWLAWWTECIPSDSNAFEGCCFWLWQDFLDGHLRFRYQNSRNTPGLFAGIGSKEAGTKVDKSQSCSADHRDQLMNLFGRPPCYNLVTKKDHEKISVAYHRQPTCKCKKKHDNVFWKKCPAMRKASESMTRIGKASEICGSSSHFSIKVPCTAKNPIF